MFKEYLEEFKNGNKLVDAVMDYYIDRYGNDDTPEEMITSMKDLQSYGCVSGMIGDLIYYEDTIKFYEEYKEEINQLLSELVSDTGLSIEELFGDKFDKEDPLVLEQNNQNLLAWFGFEETSRKLYEEMEEKKFEPEKEEPEEELEEDLEK